MVEAMLPWMSFTADPGRVHSEGRTARAALEDARAKVAALLGARPREVVFTSGATEAIAAAVWGAVERGPHQVVPAVEHSAVRDAAARYDVTEVGVDGLGRVDADEVAAAIRPGETALVHVQWANHEVGTVQPVAEVVDAVRRRAPGVLVHVDAAAAAGHVPIDFATLEADLVSVSAHKLGGPQGIGALVVRRGLRLRPLLLGGAQERSRRAGMENVAAAVGFGAAAETLAVTLAPEAARARAQTDAALTAATAIEGVTAYGDPDGRLPHLVCMGVDGVEAEAVLLGLDQAGVAAHSGSACSSESLEPSPVLAAMGVAAERSLRVSVGWSTTDDDVAAFSRALPEVVQRLRRLGARQ
ncbi:MAG: aminotransferase class V-fold PLP-dependent enzyme [Actinomycetota bacterium]|nr:aminotransferase class V-fold PLP-dependent enzyme [Actinomycetota bacterium]